MNILICDDLPEEMITLDNLLHQSGFPVTTMLFHRAGDALSYVLKPPTANVVKTGGVTKVIPHRRISHTEAMGHSVILHMTDGSELPVNTIFSEISAALLSDPCFIRCHRSYVVNMLDIDEISKLHITTHTNKRIPIPRSYGDTRTKFYQWKFGGDSSGAY